MRRVIRLIEKIAPTEATVLITGESGTGKELVARAIHQLSPRSARVFLAINAGAFPEHLIESELFGHVRGAFTGADRERRGLFEEANGGTLFLDEVAEMAPHLQVRLLRVLESGEVRPVGSAETRRVDVRVIAATNQDPLVAVRRGTLREDLFYRLNVFHLVLPPLRERREDIPLLAAYFVERKSRELGKEVTRFAPDAQRALMRYEYPGNVRELAERHRARGDPRGRGRDHAREPAAGDERQRLSPRNRHEPRPAAGAGPGGMRFWIPTAVGSGDEWRRPRRDPGSTSAIPATWSLAEVERAHIERVLTDLGGNVSLAARRLGISRTTLWRKMKHHELTSPRPGHGGDREMSGSERGL